MEYFRTRKSYEEIDRIPQRGRKKLLNYLVITVLTLCIGSVVVVVLVKMINPSNVPVSPDYVYNSSNGDSKDILGASVPKIVTQGDEQDVNNGNTVYTPGGPVLEDILLDLDIGKILGKRMISRAGKEYLAFLGIPYAKPPLGELRFQPPAEPEPWIGTLNATEFKPDCIQKDKYNVSFVTRGSEDCLYLNVYTPKSLASLKKQDDSNRFPVMILIHGGKQYGNATRYGAEYFMDEDVILVTFHYRIGVLGNLNTKTMEARGNQGLKDQVMAMKWVKDNIKAFGGNQRKVTIFGNSYGGIQVSSHLLSPMSDGLFERVICQSGTQLMPLQFTQDPLKSAIELGDKLQFTGNTTKDLVTFFQNIHIEKLVLTSYLIDFGTTVELPSNTNDVFLSDTPLNILQSGEFNKVDSIFGVVSAEGLMFSLPILTSPNLIESYNENWELMAVQDLNLNNFPLLKDPERIANATRDFYLRTNKLSRKVETNFTAMFSDRKHFHPSTVFASSQLDKNKRKSANVFLYYFNVDADKSYGDSLLEKYRTDNFLGTGHADELQFLFPYDPFPFIQLDSKYGNFSKMLIRLWVSFANNGKPSGADNGADWFPIEKKKPYKWFEISQDPGMIDFLGDRMSFWDSFNLTDLYI